jgi:hypothetical protein
VKRRAFTMAEIAITAGVLAALGIPVLALLTAGTRETIASEDNVEAELTCSRLIEEKLAAPWKELDRSAPVDEWLEADVNPDRGGPRPATPGAALPARGYRVHRTLRRVTPDLLSLEVCATWKAESRVRRYAILRLIGRETVSASGGPTE